MRHEGNTVSIDALGSHKVFRLDVTLSFSINAQCSHKVFSLDVSSDALMQSLSVQY